MADGKKLTVTLVDGHSFRVEPHGGTDVASQARRLLDGPAVEQHEGGSFTLHASHRIASVTVGERKRAGFRPD